MKILVTGASGFIGSHVVPAFLARKHEVRVLARASSDLSLLPRGVEVVRGELGDAAPAINGCAGGCAGLVHLAGVSGGLFEREGRDRNELRAVNVNATRKVFSEARQAGVRRAVLVTTAWTMLRPELASQSPYLASRIEAERIAFNESGSGLETTVVCPTFVVGAGDRGPNFPGALVLALLRGRVPFVPAGGMTWIAVRDMASTIVAALERGEPGKRYLAGAEFIPHDQLFMRVGQIAGITAPSIVVSKPVLRGLATVGDFAIRVLGRRSSIPLRLGVDLLSIESPIDCSETWWKLGAPREPVTNALREAVSWFRQHGYSRRRAVRAATERHRPTSA